MERPHLILLLALRLPAHVEFTEGLDLARARIAHLLGGLDLVGDLHAELSSIYAIFANLTALVLQRLNVLLQSSQFTFNYLSLLYELTRRVTCERVLVIMRLQLLVGASASTSLISVRH